MFIWNLIHLCFVTPRHQNWGHLRELHNLINHFPLYVSNLSIVTQVCICTVTWLLLAIFPKVHINTLWWPAFVTLSNECNVWSDFPPFLKDALKLFFFFFEAIVWNLKFKYDTGKTSTIVVVNFAWINQAWQITHYSNFGWYLCHFGPHKVKKIENFHRS